VEHAQHAVRPDEQATGRRGARAGRREDRALARPARGRPRRAGASRRGSPPGRRTPTRCRRAATAREEGPRVGSAGPRAPPAPAGGRPPADEPRSRAPRGPRARCARVPKLSSRPGRRPAEPARRTRSAVRDAPPQPGWDAHATPQPPSVRPGVTRSRATTSARPGRVLLTAPACTAASRSKARPPARKGLHHTRTRRPPGARPAGHGRPGQAEARVPAPRVARDVGRGLDAPLLQAEEGVAVAEAVEGPAPSPAAGGDAPAQPAPAAPTTTAAASSAARHAVPSPRGGIRAGAARASRR
jgi:hypothetical protein